MTQKRNLKGAPVLGSEASIRLVLDLIDRIRFLDVNFMVHQRGWVRRIYNFVGIILPSTTWLKVALLVFKSYAAFYKPFAVNYISTRSNFDATMHFRIWHHHV